MTLLSRSPCMHGKTNAMPDTDYKFAVSLASNESWNVLRQLEESGLRFQIEVEPSGFGSNQVGIYLHVEDHEQGLNMLGLSPVEDGVNEEWLEAEPLPDFDETPIDSGMALHFPGKTTITNPTTGDVFRALEEMDARAKTLVTLGPNESDFLETAGDPSVGFSVELHSADPDKRFRSERGDLTLTDTFHVMIGYLRRTKEWPSLITWVKVRR